MGRLCWCFHFRPVGRCGCLKPVFSMDATETRDQYLTSSWFFFFGIFDFDFKFAFAFGCNFKCATFDFDRNINCIYDCKFGFFDFDGNRHARYQCQPQPEYWEQQRWWFFRLWYVLLYSLLSFLVRLLNGLLDVGNGAISGSQLVMSAVLAPVVVALWAMM